MNRNTVIPKMTRQQAKMLWNNMSADEKAKFNDMLRKLYSGKLMLTNVCVDDNEQIQRIILDDKDKPGKPIAPFGKHFGD